MYVHYYGYSCIRYISYEFLGLFEALYGGTVFTVCPQPPTRGGTREDC